MLPIYALIQPLLEPIHQRMRGRVPFWGRALVYAGGFHAAEYVSGRLLRRLMGRAPWALAGLMTERLHDILTAQAPVRRRRPARP